MNYFVNKLHRQGFTQSRKQLVVFMFIIAVFSSFPMSIASASQLRAGVAKVNITDTKKPVNDSLYARALVMSDGAKTTAIISLDIVAIEGIGYVSKGDFLKNVRSKIEKELNIKPKNVMVNVTHCHGVPCSDIEQRTVTAVKKAAENMVPVNVGAGVGYEDRIMVNRRMQLKNGREWDERRAYSMPPDEDVAAVGPIDPEIGILKIDRKDGRTLAVLYNFAMHPIMGAASGGNTADVTGFSSKVIEDNLSDGTVAMFIQGCAGDINPAYYKAVSHPSDPEPLGNMLGLSTLSAIRKIKTKNDNRFKFINETIELPRRNAAKRIKEMEAERISLLDSLKGTSLNLKTYMYLTMKYSMFPTFPSYYSQGYLHDQQIGKKDLVNLDKENRMNMEQYLRNVRTMERLTVIYTNLELLRAHQKEYEASKTKTVSAEMLGIRVGDFVLTTFPGELTVQIGLNLKKKSPHKLTFVAGYTNGYIYYTPTEKQLKNIGGAQEDSECIVAPGWQKQYEEKAMEILKKL